MAAPSLDGSSATGQASGGTTVAATLTTSNTNDIICALISVEKTSTLLWVTGVSGGGLTWQKRNSMLTGSVTLELWYAVAASALSAQTITATFNATIDDATILVWGVSGCNTAQPWEPNPACAQWVPNVNSSTPSFTYSTSNANNFLIIGAGSNSNWSPPGTVTGFTSIGGRLNSGGANFSAVGALYKQVTATQSGVTSAWSSTVNQSNCSFFEALTADSSSLVTLPFVNFFASGKASSTTTVTTTVGTQTSGEVFVLLAYAEASGGGPAISTVSDGGTLTWSLRKRSHGSSRGSFEIWTAPAPSGLSSKTLTVTYGATFDAACIIVLGVANCTSAIFDSNGSVPAALSNNGSNFAPPSLTGISTSQQHDMLIAAVGGATNTASNYNTPPSGFLFMQAVAQAATQGAALGAAVKYVSATQSSQTITWGGNPNDGSGATIGGEYVVDALTSSLPTAGSGKGFFMGIPAMISGAAAMRAYRALEENPVTRRRDALGRLLGG